MFSKKNRVLSNFPKKKINKFELLKREKVPFIGTFNSIGTFDIVENVFYRKEKEKYSSIFSSVLLFSKRTSFFLRIPNWT